MFDLKEVDEIRYKVKIKVNEETGKKTEEIILNSNPDLEVISLLTGINFNSADTENRVFVC